MKGWIKKATMIGIAAIAMIPAIMAPAFGHDGSLDEIGCHQKIGRYLGNQAQPGNYHCHQGPLAGRTFSNKADAVKLLPPQPRKNPWDWQGTTK